MEKNFSYEIYISGEKIIFDLTNSIRQKLGVHPLKFREEALSVAREHAHQMLLLNYFAHQSPDGKQLWDRLSAKNINFFTCGENLAKETCIGAGLNITKTLPTSAKNMFQGLLNSPGHKENILSPSFRQLAIGVMFKCSSNIYEIITVQVFTD